jgi:hypothetical protein
MDTFKLMTIITKINKIQKNSSLKKNHSQKNPKKPFPKNTSPPTTPTGFSFPIQANPLSSIQNIARPPHPIKKNNYLNEKPASLTIFANGLAPTTLGLLGVSGVSGSSFLLTANGLGLTTLGFLGAYNI